MRNVLFAIILFPLIAIAGQNTNYIFKEVKRIDDKVVVVFHDMGIRYIVEYRGEEFVSQYNQEITLKVGESVNLREKHSHFVVTAVSINLLKIKETYYEEDKLVEKNYELNVE